jgi:AraC-like DNA-binding protein
MRVRFLIDPGFDLLDLSGPLFGVRRYQRDRRWCLWHRHRIQRRRGAKLRRSVGGQHFAVAPRRAGLGSLSAAAGRLVAIFRLLEFDPPSDRIRRALAFARTHLSEELSVSRLAEVVRLRQRQFSRAFAAETAVSPAKAVERLRAEAAKPTIENSREPLALIARAAGFSDPERMRQAFVRSFGQPPQALWRQSRGTLLLPIGENAMGDTLRRRHQRSIQLVWACPLGWAAKVACHGEVLSFD